MNESLTEIIELSRNDEFKTIITLDQILRAKEIIANEPKSSDEIFKVLCSMNLINAAIKSKEFKEVIYYGMLKPRVSKLLNYILNDKTLWSKVQFYIDKKERCAYIEIYNLQFGFHNITIDEDLKDFIESPFNITTPWRGIRLQKIAGELFNYALDK